MVPVLIKNTNLKRKYIGLWLVCLWSSVEFVHSYKYFGVHLVDSLEPVIEGHWGPLQERPVMFSQQCLINVYSKLIRKLMCEWMSSLENLFFLRSNSAGSGLVTCRISYWTSILCRYLLSYDWSIGSQTWIQQLNSIYKWFLNLQITKLICNN